MVYPRGPFGKRTYFIYLDKKGAMNRWDQVLAEKNFEKIIPGMHREEAASAIGESQINVVLARERGYVWHYRYVTPIADGFKLSLT